MKRRLEQFYESFGDRGIMFILYAFSVVVNVLLTWNMELPAVYPDEITVAGTAALYSGINKWPVLSSVSGSAGYVQALFYAPLYRLFTNQFALYKTMLVVNALLISFIPMIIYHLAAKLGVPRVHQKLIIAVSCGMYITYIADSKYIWNETVMALLCWLIMLSFFNSWDKKVKTSRFSNSVLLGFLCAVAYAASTRLLALTVALILTMLIAQIFFHEKVVNLPVFAISLGLSFTGEHFLRGMLENTITFSASTFSIDANFLARVFSHIYAFSTSTLGFGTLAAAITVVMVLTLVREGTQKRTDTQNREDPEGNTKVYEPIKHKYSIRLTMFALFQFFAVILTGALSAMTETAETMNLLGKFTDNLAPLALFLVLVFIYLYDLDLKKILLGVGLYTYVCICFAAVGYPLIKSLESVAEDRVNGLMPVSFGAEGDTSMTYIIMSSCVYTMLALFAVYAYCSRKHRNTLMAASAFMVIVTSTAYLGGVFLPAEAKAASAELEPFRKVSDLLYNDPQSPPIIVYETDPRLAATVQFLAPRTVVSYITNGEKAPESCLLIAENGVEVPFERGSYENVGRTDKYTVYAFGESARDFIRYSSSKS